MQFEVYLKLGEEPVHFDELRRRDFIPILVGSAILSPFTVIAQTPPKIYRLSSLTGSVPLNPTSGEGAVLIAALAQRGYVLGQNLVYEARGAAGQLNQVPEILQRFKNSNVDIVVAVGYPAALGAKALGIPTVIAYGSGDPVATGLVDGLARPGGMVTGVSDVATTLSTKRLSLLKELLPKLRRVAMLWNWDDLGMSLRYEASAKAAQSLGVTVQPFGVREPNDFDGAFEEMDRDPPEAILMVSDSLTNLNRKHVFDFAAAKRLPAIYEYDSLVRDGGLMSYGPDLKESFQRVAAMIDRIFKGAKPSELPFEQPTRYLFVINLRTAKALPLEIPPTLLALADEVIE